jgi:hypothetical protein
MATSLSQLQLVCAQLEDEKVTVRKVRATENILFCHDPEPARSPQHFASVGVAIFVQASCMYNFLFFLGRI